MLEAYQQLQDQLKQKREAEMRPEQKIEEKKSKEAVEVADSVSTEGIAKEIGRLKSEIGVMLAQLSDKLESEIGKYLQVKQAVAAREKELQEIYEIERTASTLTALLEVQQQKRVKFEAEMAEQERELESEIEAKREEWEKEKQAHEAEIKERSAAEKKARDRDMEEFKYQFEREQQLAREKFEYEKAKLERDAQLRREELGRDLAAREKALAEGENELRQLREKADAFPKQLEAAIAKAVQETADRLKQEAQGKQELLKKEFEGERNVLTARIEALQQTVKEQTARTAGLSAQLEKSYGQVQEIAVRAIEGSSKAIVYSQPVVSESSRRTSQSDG
jgi:DNA repair exonuclease SbcCD ATPase subunit